VTRWTSLALLPLLCAVAAAQADQVMLSASKDTTIYAEGNTLSNGAGNGIFAGRSGPNNNGAIRRALIAFDVAAAVPAGSTITSVELTLRVAMTQAGATAVGLHRLLADWGEATSNADGNEGMGATAAMGDATWRFRFFNDLSKQWTKAGGDFASAVSAVETVGDIGSFATWGSTPMMVADVQGWLDAPATNFGWLIRDSEDTVRTTKKFHSRQTVTASNRPQLLVVFDQSAPATATVTAVPSATATPPASATATRTASPTPTASALPSATGTVTVPATATRTLPASATVTASATASATANAPTATATATQTAGATATATAPTAATATETETAATPTATASQPPPACVGDCDGNGTVIISELIIGVNIALDRSNVAVCRAFDTTGDGRVTINELVAAVGNALGSC
jgi:hypothetical protein